MLEQEKPRGGAADTGGNRGSDVDIETRLLDAAKALVLERGYVRTSISAIAERAEVDFLRVLRHFENREALFFVMIDREVDRARAAFKGDVPTFDTALEAARFVVAGYKQSIQETDAPILKRIALAEARSMPALAEMYRSAEGKDQNTSMAEHFYNTWVAQGVFRKANATFAARQFIGMMSHYLIDESIVIGASPADIDDYLEDCAQMFAARYGA